MYRNIDGENDWDQNESSGTSLALFCVPLEATDCL